MCVCVFWGVAHFEFDAHKKVGEGQQSPQISLPQVSYLGLHSLLVRESHLMTGYNSSKTILYLQLRPCLVSWVWEPKAIPIYSSSVLVLGLPKYWLPHHLCGSTIARILAQRAWQEFLPSSLSIWDIWLCSTKYACLSTHCGCCCSHGQKIVVSHPFMFSCTSYCSVDIHNM